MIRTLLSLAGALFLVAAAPHDVGGWRLPEENLDPNVAPAQDFYDFATGGWRQAHPIPPEYARWGVFDVLAAETREKVHAILEEAAARPGPEGSDQRKAGDFYASGMDEEAIEAAGITPILPEIQRIAAIDGIESLQDAIAHLQEIGVDALFGFGNMPDPKQSDMTIGLADQGGLGLPDPSYYLDADPRSQSIRAAYAQHAAALLQLLGGAPAEAQRDAAAALRIETALAAASMTRVERRDPYATYNPRDREGLAAMTPHFSWPRYFTLVGRPDLQRIDVGAPRFFAEVDRLLATTSLDDWKAYLRLRLIDMAAPYLTRAFVDESFRFSAQLTGVERQLPRWMRVLNATNQALGFAVGKLFVEKHFPPEAKAEVLAMLEDIQGALRKTLATLSWMGPDTRQRAIEKLDLMTNRIGYPDVWRDYSTLAIDRGSYVANVFRANAFEARRELARIDKPTDRTEWEMTPQTVNAYYNPSLNEIVFPAGILQPPFFDPKAPTAWNYGAIGAVIAHEITHGFDDEGSQYDGHGNLNDWWTQEDAARFHARTACIAEQFSQFTVAGGVHVNGRLVTGEATADLGGVKLSLRALRARSQEEGQVVPGRSREQIFFLSYANVWASNARPEQERLLAIVDPHPPPRFRVNGTLANLPEFQAAFDIPDGSPMVHVPRCEIW
ncbi:MAG: M13 family metallopeptidase [Minicystis sp.]